MTPSRAAWSPSGADLIPKSGELRLGLSPTLSPGYRMPVTAKLSKRFYEVLGEDVANELVD